MDQSFEEAFKLNLIRCAEAYAQRKNIKLSTLGRLVANDSPFFTRLNDTRKNFTVRKYDEVIGWFSVNWPNDLRWPDGVSRPNAASLPEHTA